MAGYFYPAEKTQILRVLEKFIGNNAGVDAFKAAISPHAGYAYSGATAGEVFSRTEIPETVILLGPNHTGYGEPYSVASHDSWLTPLGETEIDKPLAQALVKESRYLHQDAVAHIKEHSIEVQLPFLQFLRKDVRIVPIVLSGYVDDPAWIDIGESIAQVLRSQKRENSVLIVASSDMTHYEENAQAEEKDAYAIEAIVSLDEQLLAQRIYERDITMCGFGPVIVSIVAAKLLGAKHAELVRYTTSGAVSGERSKVVGYAGILIK